MSTQTKNPSPLRRTLAGVAAAITIAVGGLSMVSASDANAAGVHTTNYAVQTSTVTVAAPSDAKKTN